MNTTELTHRVGRWVASGVLPNVRRSMHALVAGLLCLPGFSTPAADPQVVRSIHTAGEHLDAVEDHIAEWGHASFSGFLLIEHHDVSPGPFSLGLNESATNYMARIRASTQGRAAFLDQRALSLELDGKIANSLKTPGTPAVSTNLLARQDELGELEHQIRLTQLKQQLALAQATTNAPLTNLFSLNAPAPAGSGTNITNITTNIVNITHTGSNGPAFSPTDFGRLLANPAGNVSLSESTILKLAATAKETERTLNFMSDPLNLPGNKRAFFAIATVSVMPGWRTRQDYVCEVSAHFQPAMPREDLLTRGKGSAGTQNVTLENLPPTILGNSRWATEFGFHPRAISLVSAFPLVESQVFDQQTTHQSRLDFVLNLAATYLTAGYKADAEVLLKYAKQAQKDLVTRNSLPLVVPGVDANTLTYRFDPEATAMLDPTAVKPKGGQQLLPTSIPVLVLVVFDRQDLRDWSRLSVEVETRWIPRERRNPWKKAFVDIPTRLQTRGKRMSHEDALEVTSAFDRAVEILGGNGLRDLEAGQELRRRVSVLQTLGFGRSVESDLPRPSPLLTRLNPSTIDEGDAPRFEVFGSELIQRRGDEVHAEIGGVPLVLDDVQATVVRGHFGTTDKSAPASLEAGQYDLVVTTAGGTRTWAKALKVEAAKAPKAKCRIGPEDSATSRPLIEVVDVVPATGFFNGTTVVTLRGRHFKPKGFDDPVTFISVGGRMLDKVTVVSDEVLRFEVPAWTTKKTNDLDSVFVTEGVSVVVGSACSVLESTKKLRFALAAPPAPPQEPKGLSLSPELEAQVKALIAVSNVLKQEILLKGGVSLGIGATSGATTNSPPTGNTSQTIISVGPGSAGSSVGAPK